MRTEERAIACVFLFYSVLVTFDLYFGRFASACRREGEGIFDQPEESHFLRGLLGP